MHTDATAKAVLDKWKLPRPNQGLSDEEIKQYLANFNWADQNLPPPKAASATPKPALRAASSTGKKP
jgi:nitrite reductase (NO-forming)